MSMRHYFSKLRLLFVQENPYDEAGRAMIRQLAEWYAQQPEVVFNY